MIISQEAMDLLQSGQINFRFAMWFQSKNRVTNEIETVGLHTGLDNITMVVDGQVREFVGAGQILDIPSFRYQTGFNIQHQNIQLAIAAPEMVEGIKVHNPQYQPCDAHIILLENGTDRYVDKIKCFDGYIDGIEIVDEEDTSYCEVTLVNSMRQGTKPLYTKKSHEDQQLRHPEDEFRKYAATSGKGSRHWGQESEKTHRVSGGSGNFRGLIGSFGRLGTR